jgi:YfiH family protein
MPNPPEVPPTLIHPDWPAPPAVRAVTTTRRRPEAEAPDDGFNLGLPAGADPAAAAANRRHLVEALGLPAGPVWLEQVHGREVVRIDRGTAGVPRADAACTAAPGAVCAVLTADCLPVLLCDRDAREVAAVHGGWRGLQQGIIAATLERLATPPARLMAWLGPAISAAAYEVDDKVRDAFGGGAVDRAFTPTRPGHWALDLYAVARSHLNRAGVCAVYGGDYCTFGRPDLFHSHRRDPRSAGRMATLIWIEPAGGPG